MEIKSVNSEIKHVLQAGGSLEAQPLIEAQVQDNLQDNLEEGTHEQDSSTTKDGTRQSPMTLFAVNSSSKSLAATSKSMTHEEAERLVQLLKKHGQSPIAHAITSCQYDDALFLLDHADHSDKSYLISLVDTIFVYYKLQQNQIDLVNKLIDNGHYNINDFVVIPASRTSKKDICHTLLSFSLYYGLTDIFNRLLDEGADINAQNGCVLLRAVASADVEKVRFALSKGARIDVLDPRVLQVAVEDPYNSDMITLLFNHGAKFDKNSMLLNAVNKNCLDIVKLMLENGANPGKDVDLLYQAIEYGGANLVKHLLDFGLKIKGGDVSAGNHLACAIRKFDATMVSFLIEQGADLHVKLAQSDGGSLLNYALSRPSNKNNEHKKDAVIYELVKHGALLS